MADVFINYETFFIIHTIFNNLFLNNLIYIYIYICYKVKYTDIFNNVIYIYVELN